MNLRRAALIALALLATQGWERARLLADVPRECLIEDSTIEVIELNRYGYRFGCAAWLFFDVNGEVCDWINYSGEAPHFDGQRWSLMFKRSGRTYLVRAREWVETKTVYDKEVMERQRVPYEKRRRLGKYRSANPFVRVGE